MSNSSWFATRRLQSQLLTWTALILLVTVPITSEIRIRSNIELLENNLRVRSETLLDAIDHALQLTAASDFEDHVPQLEDRLRDFVDADATLTRLDIMTPSPSGPPVILASSSTLREPVLTSLPPSRTTETRQLDSDRVMITAKPVDGGRFALIAISSLENVDRYQGFNRLLTPFFVAGLILIVIVLMSIMYRRIVSHRFDELLGGIRQAKEGTIDLIPESRQDEIGLLARNFNELLGQVRSFNHDLQNQVSKATEDLTKRNLALEETTRRMIAMQQQLLQSERLATVGQMAATFAHEIGSPMSSLSAHVQLLLEDSDVTDDQRDTLVVIHQQIQAVVQIVKELLRAARRGPADFVLTDINETLRKVIRLVEPKLLSQRIEVEVDLRPVPPVRGYPLYLQEAFINIINNASEAMRDGGRLEVKSWFEEHSRMVNIHVVDSGPGIDPSVVERVFDHFVTTKAIGEGTGLGLGIVKEVVDSHRGTFHIGSVNGSGTLARITLPVEVAAERVS